MYVLFYMQLQLANTLCPAISIFWYLKLSRKGGVKKKKKKKRDSRARYVDVFTECLCVVAAPLPRHYTLLYAVGAAYLLLYYFMCVR